MWTYEHSEVAQVGAEEIWRLWSRVEQWHTWNGDIETITIDGPFAAGTRFTMTPIGDDPVELRLDEVVENRRFADVAEFDGLVIRTVHEMEPQGDQLKITYRMEISGPNADALGPEIGPQISGDFPETIASLIKHAAH